jgi:hypothetical protein
MTILDPNSRLGRSIRSGKLRAVRVQKKAGEDIAGAFVRGMYERDPAGMKAFEDRIDAIINGKGRR